MARQHSLVANNGVWGVGESFLFGRRREKEGRSPPSTNYLASVVTLLLKMLPLRERVPVLVRTTGR